MSEVTHQVLVGVEGDVLQLGRQVGADLAAAGSAPPRHTPVRRRRGGGSRAPRASRRARRSRPSRAAGACSAAPSRGLAEQLPVDGRRARSRTARGGRRPTPPARRPSVRSASKPSSRKPSSSAGRRAPTGRRRARTGPPPSRSTRAARRRRGRAPTAPLQLGRPGGRATSSGPAATSGERRRPRATTTGPPLEHLFSSPCTSGVRLAPCRSRSRGRARRRRRRHSARASRCCSCTGRVRRLVLPQGQARPRASTRPSRRSARSPRRPGSTSGSGRRCRRSATPAGRG